ncbi:MAG: hypothetical protein HOF21_15195 [Nitrospina sp.]|nr:hypothetical protein [Nitrospina sp.]MBT4390434.1 hypothetical protein [Nitrospina sp.]
MPFLPYKVSINLGAYQVADILKDAERITLKNMERGKYFRIAADVFVDGENLADMLIEAGVAVRYGGGKKVHKWCK